MGILRFAIAYVAMSCAFCGCRDRDLMRGDVLPSVRHVALQLKTNGGRTLNTVHICDEIKSEIMAITNMELRIQDIYRASEVLASMDFSRLSCADKAEGAYKYWHLFSQFYNLMSAPGISDEQRMSFLVRCLKKYKAVSFCLPMTARAQDESETDFAMRKTAILQLYSEYVNNVRLWERVFRNGALRTMMSIDGKRLDKATAFLFEYPEKTELLQNPVFVEMARTGMTSEVKGGNDRKCLKKGE